jgi:Flp pilus assembly protein TadG
MAVPTRRHDRGASLVEFAVIAPLLFLLLLGTVTGGLTLSRQNSVKNSVREATRFGAVTADFSSPDLDALYDQVVAAATGDLDVGTEGREICVALIDADTDADSEDEWTWALYGPTSTVIASDSGTNFPAVDARCTDGFDKTVGEGTRRIWVRAERTSAIEALLYSQKVTLSARSATRYEG